MNDKLKQIIIDLKDSYKQMQDLSTDAMIYEFSQRRFIGFLRALLEHMNSGDIPTIRERAIAARVMKYYLGKL